MCERVKVSFPAVFFHLVYRFVEGVPCFVVFQFVFFRIIGLECSVKFVSLFLHRIKNVWPPPWFVFTGWGLIW